MSKSFIMSQVVYISHFDDGKQKYEKYVNKWLVIGSKFNGGKLVLKNFYKSDIVVSSISSWKTEIYKEDNPS